MVVFLIPVIHPDNAINYDNVWRMLENTLFSITRQTNENYHVLVICNEVRPIRLKGIDYSKITFLSIEENIINRDIHKRQTDKLHKRQIAIRYAKKHIDPQYYYFMDADDYVAYDLIDTIYKKIKVEVCAFLHGITFDLYTGYFYTEKDIDAFCGSTVFANSNIIYENIDNEFYIANHYWRNKNTTNMLNTNTPMIAYNLHGENIYCRTNSVEVPQRMKLRKSNTKLTDELIQRFSINMEYIDN